MKKIIKIIAFIAIFLIGNTFSIDNVNAQGNLQIVNPDNIYFVHVNTDGTEYSAYQLPVYYVDGRLAYCVQPGLEINSYNYILGDWNITQLTPQQRHYIEMIGYYGYEYPGHTDNIKYYMASQELIWKAIKSMNVSWSTEKHGNGQPINIEKEKNEILSLIANHEVKPSFNGSTINAVIGDTITLNDNNRVLSGYSLYSSDDQSVSINGNALTLKVNKTGDSQVRLIRSYYDTDITLVYYSPGSQTMAHLRMSDPVVSAFNIKSVAGKVSINKVDKDLGKNTAQGEATLNGAIYDIYDETDTYITSITTDSKGIATSSNLPKLGKYYLIEKTPSNGYQLDKTKYWFDMTKDELYPNIKVYEKVINRDFEFTKVYATNKTQLMTPEVGVQFGIYDNNNKLVIKKTTDKEGKIYFNLPYGKYTLKQLTTTSGYEKIKDYTFEVKNVGTTINKVFSNAEITSRIKVIKVDENGNSILKKGIKFKIKDLSTEKYVCQRVSYPEVKTYCEYETDENGILITPYPLNSGNYQLEELDQVIYGYIWNSKPLKFSINENSNIISSDDFDSIIEIKFENKEVKGTIEIKKIGEKLVIENDTYIYEEIRLSNVKFALYDATGNFIKEIVTNEDGYAKVENLKLGKYTLKEISSSNGNIVNTTPYEFELKYKNQYTPVVIKNINLKNYLPKGTLEFSKVDLSTSEPLPNTKIQIYTDKDILIYEGITDENGKIKINDLSIGKYYILEKEAPEGYILNSEKMYFEIKENNEIVKCTMTNEKMIEIEVPKTGLNDYSFIIYISLSILLLVSAIGVYAKK